MPTRGKSGPQKGRGPGCLKHLILPLEDEVEPLSNEGDPEHGDAQSARGVVGRGEEKCKEVLGISQKGDPEPRIL